MPVLGGALFSIGSQQSVALVRATAAGQLSRAGLCIPGGFGCVGPVSSVRTKGPEPGLVCLSYGWAVLKLFFVLHLS